MDFYILSQLNANLYINNEKTRVWFIEYWGNSMGGEISLNLTIYIRSSYHLHLTNATGPSYIRLINKAHQNQQLSIWFKSVSSITDYDESKSEIPT